MLQIYAIAALLGCVAVMPSTAFTGRSGFAKPAGGGRQNARNRRAAISTSDVWMTAVGPPAATTVVNAVGSAGLDHTWIVARHAR